MMGRLRVGLADKEDGCSNTECNDSIDLSREMSLAYAIISKSIMYMLLILHYNVRLRGFIGMYGFHISLVKS